MNAKEHSSCNRCMPLIRITASQPFEKWGIYFIGPISPAAKYTQARYIIVAIDYCTKWAEARATRKTDARSTAKFLYEQVISSFGCPLVIISDYGSHFVNEVIAVLLSEFLVIHHKSTPYYPQEYTSFSTRSSTKSLFHNVL